MGIRTPHGDTIAAHITTRAAAGETTAHGQEAVMGQVIPQQHPAVVLRSHYELVRALLTIAVVVVVCLSVAIAVVVADDDSGRAPSAGDRAQPARVQAPHLPPATRFDGGPEEGTRGAVRPAAPAPRFDGGPEEGTRGAVRPAAPAPRFDGGPEEGTRGAGH